MVKANNPLSFGLNASGTRFGSSNRYSLNIITREMHYQCIGCSGRKEGNILFNDVLNTFCLRLYGVGHMVNDHSDSEREETRCRHKGYSLRLAARVLQTG